MTRRLSKAVMVRAHILPEHLRPGLKLVFCGTAAGRQSALQKAYYAHPQNKFWRTLKTVGLTPRLFTPQEYPALWENKALGVSSWKDVVKRGVVLSKPIYAAQLALYQAYMDLPAPALFTALNRDTWEIHCELVPFDAALAQTMSDRAVQVVQASDAQELLPRVVAERTSVVCRGGKTSGGWHGPCSWQDRCWGGCR